MFEARLIEPSFRLIDLNIMLTIQFDKKILATAFYTIYSDGIFL